MTQPWDTFIKDSTMTYGQSGLGRNVTGGTLERQPPNPALGTDPSLGTALPRERAMANLQSGIGYRQAGMERKREMEQGLYKQMGGGSLRY